LPKGGALFVTPYRVYNTDMSWISITISAYFLGAFAVLLDKFLLGSKRISSPQIYTFYAGIFGLGAFLFAPFGFSVPSVWQITISLVSGAVYVGGLLALNISISKAEASRVTPVVFSVVPIATYLISFGINDEKLTAAQLFGVALLIFGGLLISFDLPLKVNKRKFFAGFYTSCLAGLLLAIAYVMFKQVYIQQSFLNGFMWTRLGGFVGALFLLIVPVWRKGIFGSFRHAKKPSREHVSTGGIFVGNKMLGGLSSILLNKAFQLGSVTLVNSMVSLQYVFVLILVAIAAKKHPKVFAEKLLFWDWAQKVGAIAIVAVGMVLISR
jgi:drug/metabolite transporter (DMT)-like permease